MKRVRKNRLLVILGIVFGVGSAMGLVLYALRQNINLYYTPTQLLAEKMPSGREIRLGGIVKMGSVWHQSNSLSVNFDLGDGHHEIPVYYYGILPALFREGQGLVTQGHLNQAGVFVADQVLAKHDAKYKPR